MAKAGLAAAGFLLGTMGVAAGSVLNAPAALPGPGGSQAQPTAPAGTFVLSSKLQSGEDRPQPTAEVQARAILPTPVVQPTPRPTFVPKPYSAPAPPTTPSQAEEQQKLHATETQIADADKKLHTVIYVPPAAGAAAAQPRPGQPSTSQIVPAAPTAPDAPAGDQTDMTSPDQTDQTDQTDAMSQ